MAAHDPPVSVPDWLDLGVSTEVVERSCGRGSVRLTLTDATSRHLARVPLCRDRLHHASLHWLGPAPLSHLSPRGTGLCSVLSRLEKENHDSS